MDGPLRAALDRDVERGPALRVPGAELGPGFQEGGATAILQRRPRNPRAGRGGPRLPVVGEQTLRERGRPASAGGVRGVTPSRGGPGDGAGLQERLHRPRFSQGTTRCSAVTPRLFAARASAPRARRRSMVGGSPWARTGEGSTPGAAAANPAPPPRPPPDPRRHPPGRRRPRGGPAPRPGGAASGPPRPGRRIRAVREGRPQLVDLSGLHEPAEIFHPGILAGQRGPVRFPRSPASLGEIRIMDSGLFCALSSGLARIRKFAPP